MPVRTVPKNYRNLTGLVHSTRTQSSSMFESTLERDFLLLLDFDPAVARYEEQPVMVEYDDSDGRRHRYTPDILVHYHRDSVSGSTLRPLLGEIKYRDDLRQHWVEYKPKFKAAYRYAKARGWRFQLITEREIRTPYLANVKFLRSYRREPIDESRLTLIRETLGELQQADPGQLLAAITGDRWHQAELLPSLWHLVALTQVGAELSQPLTMRSRLWSVSRC